MIPTDSLLPTQWPLTNPCSTGGACEVKDTLWQLAVDQVLVKLVDSETQVRRFVLVCPLAVLRGPGRRDGLAMMACLLLPA